MKQKIIVLKEVGKSSTHTTVMTFKKIIIPLAIKITPSFITVL
jgi:hypothetical protein